MNVKLIQTVLSLSEPGQALLEIARKHADVDLRGSINELENLRWLVVGLDKHGVQCLTQFEEGLARLKDALTVIQAAKQAVNSRGQEQN
ncbi:hypothetical protein [Chromobacterium haemolyticum]|uniref:hypothetical protein n=1 Tax=Chromobacterium haemolyticum TaxID=394935 RepID=UPI00244CEE36|nr:hypothetical protein [Chromobacterium haemolyticum]MDH0342128.1 hypothetical protein [Chromobacterium haemolyticum]